MSGQDAEDFKLRLLEMAAAQHADMGSPIQDPFITSRDRTERALHVDVV